VPLGPQSQLRVARPSRDLAAAERFWVDGLGLTVLWRSQATADGGHALLMVGWPQAGWHLELVDDPATAAASPPSDEDLLVLYLDGPVGEHVVERLVAAGGSRVTARNPYWETWGVTVQDPDGYRLVLSTRGWSS
jgi:catechol 2,3-dioxygenase-like lactoylglutathione lyase family enzyme